LKLHRLVVAFAFTLCSLGTGSLARAQVDPQVIAAQKEAMKALAMMDGVWRGPAWTILPTGEKLNVTQTERVGPFLDGAVRVMEGRGYDAGNNLKFNAFGTVSYDVVKKAYTLHTYAMGHVGDFPLTANADGFVWEIPAGPMTIRYTCTIKNGEWHEVGDRIVPGQEPVRFLEMTLKRVGDSDWPAAGAIPPK
jgi:hypothetical protein